MNATILHESRGRIPVPAAAKTDDARSSGSTGGMDSGKVLVPGRVTVHERTCCVILYYDGTRQAVLNEIRHFSWQEAERTTALPAHSQPGAEPGIRGETGN